MVDELRYNDRGNEVTLIKRFAARRRGRADDRTSRDRGPAGMNDPRPTLLVVDDEPEVLRFAPRPVPPGLPRR